MLNSGAINLNYHSLISEILDLYSRVVARSLRIGRGLGKVWTKRHHDETIASPLHDYLDRIDKKSKVENNTIDSAGSGASTENQENRSKNKDARDTPSDESPEFEKYFQSRKAATLLVPEIGKKLRDSAWTHLHEAIRYSRKGDMENARLHADLADGTLKEAVQYMSRKDFEELLMEIKSKFEEVLGDTGG